MMNDLFWDMINQGNTAIFIDNIIVTRHWRRAQWASRRGIEEAGRKQLVCQTRKVLVESKRDRIPRYSNWSLESWNAKEKGGWSVKLASTKECKRDTKISGAHQLL